MDTAVKVLQYSDSRLVASCILLLISPQNYSPRFLFYKKCFVTAICIEVLC
jgi:hypothetical protein